MKISTPLSNSAVAITMAASSSLYPMVPLFDFILGCAPKLLLLFRFSPAPAFSPLRQSFNLNSYFQFPSTQFNFPLIYRKIRDASSPEASSDKKLKIKMSSGVSSVFNGGGEENLKNWVFCRSTSRLTHPVFEVPVGNGECNNTSTTRLCDTRVQAPRRYEAAGWLRKMIGVVAAKDLPAKPSEEEFSLGLRSGIILCNVINKDQSGVVPKHFSI